MARLNDPPQPSGETVESLRRKFIRQNRELARVNSTQSVRIRNLEAEVSRLLSENVALREEIIRLNFELERKPSGDAWDRFHNLRQELGSRLSELNGLLQELERKPPKRKASRQEPDNATSPKQGLRIKPRLNGELSGDTEGRLPVILEDGCDRRKSSTAMEDTHILPDAWKLMDSPDIGPPPIARSEENNANALSPSRNESKPQSNQNPGNGVTLHAENRKKRRESFHHMSAEQAHLIENNDTRSVKDRKTTQPLKSGARRKMNIRDGEEKISTSREITNPRRKYVAENATENAILSAPGKYGKGSSRDEAKKPDEHNVNVAGQRKALVPKSVNSNPTSPMKEAREPLKERKVVEKGEPIKTTRARGSTKESDAVLPPTKPKSKDAVVKEDIVHPPKTPAIDGLDLFSPTVSDPSEPRPERGDTPPPPDLGADSTGSFSRGSRRSRGSVSYAEPNLRDKMRRPTKELIDAVSAGERSRQATNVKWEADLSSLEANLAGLQIKQGMTSDAQPVWRTKPVQESKSQQERQRTETSSPLGKKATSPAGALPASVVTDRRRGSSSLAQRGDDKGGPALGTGSATAIAALSTAGQRQRSRDGQLEGFDRVSNAASQDRIEQASIFDFTSSSPEPHDKVGTEGSVDKPIRMSRRHSSVTAMGEHGKGSLRISRRKRDSVVDPTDGEARVEGGPRLRHAQSAMDLEGDPGGSQGRAASRRRSMMI